jgi:hypothetical protein
VGSRVVLSRSARHEANRQEVGLGRPRLDRRQELLICNKLLQTRELLGSFFTIRTSSVILCMYGARAAEVSRSPAFLELGILTIQRGAVRNERIRSALSELEFNDTTDRFD